MDWPALAPASSHALGHASLAALLISNMLVAGLSAAAFMSTSHARGVYRAVGGLAGAFSLAVGLCFLVGWADVLPGLQHLVGADRT